MRKEDLLLLSRVAGRAFFLVAFLLCLPCRIDRLLVRGGIETQLDHVQLHRTIHRVPHIPNCETRDWGEMDVHWPMDDGDRFARRTYGGVRFGARECKRFDSCATGFG